jgi:hypothetical protein
VVALTTLLLSRQGTQQGDPLGMLLFALAIQPLVLRIQSERDLDLNLWYADDGTLVGSVAEVAKAYQILKDEGQKSCFFLVPHKTSLWWLTMDCVLLRLQFDCRLDVDVNDLPLPRIVLVGSPVGSDEFVKQHLSAKSAKVDPNCHAHVLQPWCRSTPALFRAITYSVWSDQALAVLVRQLSV